MDHDDEIEQPMTPEEEAYYAELERQCRASYTSAGPDPYGSDCDLERGHAGRHSGPSPFSDTGRVHWSGGGMCAGDPLPTSDVEFTDGSAS